MLQRLAHLLQEGPKDPLRQPILDRVNLVVAPFLIVLVGLVALSDFGPRVSHAKARPIEFVLEDGPQHVVFFEESSQKRDVCLLSPSRPEFGVDEEVASILYFVRNFAPRK